jgi:hypothetical protein
MDISEIQTAAKTVAGEPAKLLTEVETYESDLISFVTKHKGLAAQFAFVICVPVAFIAFEVGKHFHS